MNKVSFVSLNIEGNRHLERVRAFISKEKPDVICLQEMLEESFVSFEKDFGMRGVYAPMGKIPEDYWRDGGKVVGVAIFSKLPIKNSSVSFYYGNIGEIMFFDFKQLPQTEKYLLIKVTIFQKDKEYNFATTHFVWTPNGEADEHQRKALVSLLQLLEKEKSFVLCGDFNAPRGGEIFSTLAKKYKDNIPPKYDSSIDPNLHIKKGLKLMVDGLFSTPDYEVEDARLVCGVSDHCAVTAKISKL